MAMGIGHRVSLFAGQRVNLQPLDIEDLIILIGDEVGIDIQIDAEQVDLKLPAVELCQARRIVVNSHHTGGRSEETRLNSSHVRISYAVFCLKKKKKKKKNTT